MLPSQPPVGVQDKRAGWVDAVVVERVSRSGGSHGAWCSGGQARGPPWSGRWGFLALYFRGIPAARRIPGKERNKRKKRARQPRKIAIDREQIVLVDPTTLPADAEFKGYEEKVVQDLLIRTDHVLFRREKFYSPSLGKTFLGPLPVGYEHGFGPQLRSWLYVMYFGANTSEPKLLSLLRTAGVQISAGQISRLLLQEPAGLDEELGRGFQTMLQPCPYQHLDDTGTRVDGVGFFCPGLSRSIGEGGLTHMPCRVRPLCWTRGAFSEETQLLS